MWATSRDGRRNALSATRSPRCGSNHNQVLAGSARTTGTDAAATNSANRCSSGPMSTAGARGELCLPQIAHGVDVHER